MAEISDTQKALMAQVKALRKERKKTLVECAEAMGTTQPNLSQMELGNRPIPLVKLIALLDYLGAELVIKKKRKKRTTPEED